MLTWRTAHLYGSAYGPVLVSPYGYGYTVAAPVQIS